MSNSEPSGISRASLFRASCVAMVATAMCFGVRAEIMDALGSHFHLTNEQIGWVAGAAFWGFTGDRFSSSILGTMLSASISFMQEFWRSHKSRIAPSR